MNGIYPVWFLILTLIPLASAGQENIVNLETYQTDKGLSHREIFDIHQDSAGFLWLATKFGLNRFDGRNFKWWTKEKNGLADNNIHSILEDGAGWLWLFTGSNWFYKYDPVRVCMVHTHSGRVISWQERFGDKAPFQVQDISHYTGDGAGALLFSTRRNELFLFKPDSSFQKIPHAFDAPFHPQYCSTDNGIWGTLSPSHFNTTQLVKIDRSGNPLRRIQLTGTVEYAKILGEDKAGALWYATFCDGAYPVLYCLPKQGDPVRVDYEAYGLKGKSEWSKQLFFKPGDQTIWIKSKPNFFVFHPQKGLVFDFSKQYKQIIDADIRTIFFDKDNAAWIGTAYGLFRVELKANPFSRYLFTEPFVLNNAYSCRGILPVKNGLLVNTDEGRILVHIPTRELRTLPKLNVKTPNGQQKEVMYFPLALKAGADSVRWFADLSLVKQDIKTGIDHCFLWEDPAASWQIWSFYQAPEGRLWLGTNAGLAYLDSHDEKLRRAPVEKGFEALAGATILAFIKSKKGHIWLATNTGLYAWSPEKGVIDRWWTEGTGSRYIPHENIQHVCEDKAGVLWLATGGGGLIRLTIDNPPATAYRQFTIADGLSNNNLYAVYADTRENLWISSDYGIIQFDKNTFQARAYLPKDGVTHQEFNRISHFQADDGTLYFGGLNGVTVFQPSTFYGRPPPFSASLQITGFQQFDVYLNRLQDRTEMLLNSREIVLQPGDRFFWLEFALLDYSNPDQIRYAWKIEGFNDEWSYIRENFIRVSGLPAGTYTLRIRGQAANGEWSAKEIQLPVLVLRPFYEKPWFLFCCVALLLGGSFSFYKWRTGQLKARQAQLEHLVHERTKTIEKQADELRQLDRMKSRFFANVSHELRTPLTLMLGPIGSALKGENLDSKTLSFLNLARDNGQKLLQFISEILDLSKMESGKLELQEEALHFLPFLNRLVASFESHARLQNIVLNVDYQADPDLQLCLDVKKFEIVLNNLLSNALKFTPAGGTVDVVLSDLGSMLSLEVRDTGPGIHPDDLPRIFDRFYQSARPDVPTHGGTGIGLALCREYATLFGGTIRVRSRPGQGAAFVFEFPKKETSGVVGREQPETSTGSVSRPAIREKGSSTVPEGAHTILLVEDNPSLRHYIQLVLGEKYRMVVAEHGQAALHWLAGKPAADLPDMIISDVMMPVMDGFQLLDKLKNDDRWRHLPVIMLTARAGLRDKLIALRAGVDDYILKPFEEEELLARLENRLRFAGKRGWSAAAPEVAGSLRPVILAVDAEWLAEQESLLRSVLADPAFSTSEWAYKAALSERHLQRRLKVLTGMSPYQYLLEMRLLEARKLLENGRYRSVAEVAYAVGFDNAQTFTRNFRRHFGRVPSLYF